MFASIKNRQVSQLVAYIVSKKEGSVRQSLFKHPHLRGLFKSSDQEGPGASPRGLWLCIYVFL